jgi:hypothetical protein
MLADDERLKGRLSLKTLLHLQNTDSRYLYQKVTFVNVDAEDVGVARIIKNTI